MVGFFQPQTRRIWCGGSLKQGYREQRLLDSLCQMDSALREILLCVRIGAHCQLLTHASFMDLSVPAEIIVGIPSCFVRIGPE